MAEESGLLAYQSKVGCTSVTCTRDGRDETRCRGWHCPRCDEPCSSQGHRVCPVKINSEA